MDARDVIRHHEGERNKPYDDATGKELKPGGMLKGKITIGVGHNLSDRGISDAVKEMMFTEDLDEACLELVRVFPWAAALDPVRKTVLVDMSFNLGITRLSAFKNTLAAFARGDWPAAAKGMMASLWARQVGTRAQRLAAMTITGEWPKDLA